MSSRHEEVERAVASLCEVEDSYRQRTVITTLANLAPVGRRSSWHVTPAAADQVASEMRIAINTWGEPWCRAITGDDEMVLSETSRRWLRGSAVEMTRHLVAIHLLRGADAAATAVDEASRCLEHEEHGIAAASKIRALRRFESTLRA